MKKRHVVTVLLILVVVSLLVSVTYQLPQWGEQGKSEMAGQTSNTQDSKQISGDGTVGSDGSASKNSHGTRNADGRNAGSEQNKTAGVQISGIVVKQDTKEPVPGAQVFILPFSQNIECRYLDEPDGLIWKYLMQILKLNWNLCHDKAS